MADDTELILARAQGIVQGAISPLTSIIDNIFGPVSRTIGEELNERVKRFTLRSKEMLADADTKKINSVSVNILIPIIQNGAAEKNDELQDRWAALLTNATLNHYDLPSAPEILKQLTPLDVSFLQMCYEQVVDKREEGNRQSQRVSVGSVGISHLRDRWKGYIETTYRVKPPVSLTHPDPPEWAITEDNLTRLGLLRQKLYGRMPPDHDDTELVMTDLGFRFITMCQPPAP
jgi:hypothetical protein